MRNSWCRCRNRHVLSLWMWRWTWFTLAGAVCSSLASSVRGGYSKGPSARMMTGPGPRTLWFDPYRMWPAIRISLSNRCRLWRRREPGTSYGAERTTDSSYWIARSCLFTNSKREFHTSCFHSDAARYTECSRSCRPEPCGISAC